MSAILNQSVDAKFLRVAYKLAEDSRDPSSQNGAILVKDGAIIGMGTNNFPVGVTEEDARWERPIKYQFVEHAERNSIFDAARGGQNTLGATMYCPWFACADCARAIIQAGIFEVVGHNTTAEAELPRWGPSVENGLMMLKEAGVRYRWINHKFDMTIRRDGVGMTV